VVALLVLIEALLLAGTVRWLIRGLRNAQAPANGSRDSLGLVVPLPEPRENGTADESSA
jgi:hypothetical protein